MRGGMALHQVEVINLVAQDSRLCRSEAMNATARYRFTGGVRETTG